MYGYAKADRRRGIITPKDKFKVFVELFIYFISLFEIGQKKILKLCSEKSRD